MTITVFNFGDKIKKILRGDAPTIFNEVNSAKWTSMYAKQTMDLATDVNKQVGEQGLSDTLKSMSKDANRNFATGLTSGRASACYRFFNFPGAEKIVPNSVKALDVSLLETGIGKGIVSKLGGSTVIQAAQSSGAPTTANISGTTISKLAGKSMARIPILAIIFSSLLEIPNIKDGFQNGEGMQQLGRSAITVAGTTIGTAIGGALLSPILPPLGSIVGGMIGGWLGAKLGKALGNSIFGKSKKDKMLDGDYAREILQSYNNYNIDSTVTAGNTDKLLADSQQLSGDTTLSMNSMYGISGDTGTVNAVKMSDSELSDQTNKLIEDTQVFINNNMTANNY